MRGAGSAIFTAFSSLRPVEGSGKEGREVSGGKSGGVGEDEAVVAGEVVGGGDVAEGGLVHECGEGGGLAGADFEGGVAAGCEVPGEGGDEAGDEFGAGGAAVEGEGGVVADFGGEVGDVAGGDVGEVGGDEVEAAAGEGGEEVGLEEFQALGGKGELFRILAGKAEGGGGEVGEGDAGVGEGVGEAEADDAGAGAHIQDGGGGGEGGGAVVGEGFLEEFFGFRPGDESAGVAEEFAAHELDGAEEVLEGLALAAAFEEVAQGGELLFGEGAVEVHIELHAAAAEDFGEEVLHVEARVFHAGAFEPRGAAAEGFEHGLHQGADANGPAGDASVDFALPGGARGESLAVMKTLLLSLCLAVHAAADVSALLVPLLAVGPEGKGNTEAQAAWQKLTAAAGPDALPDILKAMNKANGLQANWLRGAVSVIAQKPGTMLPVEALKTLALDTKNSAAARALAFDLIKQADAAQWDALVPGLLNDPAAELRREPVQRLLEEGKSAATTAPLRKALEAARDDDQIKAAAEALREKGESVDLPRQFGFLMDWHVAGPFDNRGRKGFDTVFPPERGVDLATEYEGREMKPGEGAKVKWLPWTSGHQFGMVDFNKPVGMYKEVTGYAQTVFHSAEARDAELRLGCKNAWKLWLNGKLVFARDEYHRGAQIDQYGYPVKLKQGPNEILIKCCQNEQTETWTVEWEFQLRVCDATGTPIYSTDRKPTPEAALGKKEKAAK